MNTPSLLLQEQLPHGNAMFPLMIHEVSSDTRTEERIACHWHEEIEILVVTKGRAVLILNNNRYELMEGYVAFILPNHLHLVTALLGDTFDFYAVVFHPDLLSSSIQDTIQQQYFDSVFQETILFPTVLSRQSALEYGITDALSDIYALFTQKKPCFELLIKARLYIIWSLYYQHGISCASVPVRASDYRIALVKSIIDYIHTHYESQITLDVLAAYFHLSREHLCRVFKKMTRMSPIEYLNFYRIGNSTRLLLETDRGISDIALEIGFNNISYFNRTFKKYMHVTPGKYRSNSRQQ